MMIRIDPDFKGLPVPEQIKVLQNYDPEYQRQKGQSPFGLTTGIPRSKTAVAKYVGKELVGGVGDIVKGTVGLFKPPESQGEKTLSTLDPSGGALLPVTRAVKGMLTPLADLPKVPGAIKDIAESKYGGPALGLTIPRAVGQAGGMYLTGKAVEVAPKVLPKLKSAARITSQEIAGAGREPIAKATRAREAKVAARETRYQERSAKASEKFIKETHEAKQSQAAEEKLGNRREVLERSKEAYSDIVKKNVDEAHQAVRQSLNERWNALREKIGAETPVDATKVYDAIEEAKKEYLRGSPASLKQFNDLIKEMGVDELVEQTTGGLKAAPGAKMPWQTARTHYSNVGERLASGGLPGNVFKALQHVEKGLDGVLTDAARRFGSGAEYGALKNDWSQYMRDWNDMSALSTGGSPLARILRAKDPAMVDTQVLGESGDRLISTVAKYKKHGASPRLFTAMREVNNELAGLPEPKKLSALPEKAVVSSPRELPPIDPKRIRLEKLEEFAGRPFRWYDLFPPYLAEHLLLKSFRFRQWVASQPRTELPPL